MIPGYGRDDGNAGDGINLVPGVWNPPEHVSAEWAAAARLWMRAAEAEEEPVVAPKDLHKWLNALIGNMRLAGSMDAEDVDARIKMLSVAINERKAKHFTVDSLKLAWRRFGDFVPTAHQLMAFFDDLESTERTEAQRLMAVLDAAARPAQPRSPVVDVERSMALNREKWDRERAELIAAAGIEVPDIPPRMPHETDREYGVRLAEEAKRQCDIGGRALRREEARRRAPTADEMRKAAEAFHAAHPPQEHGPPPPPEVSQNAQFVKPKELDGGEGERLANMMADPTTEDDP